jgi:pimeloyl-ACP methyl ester carboxylesterase
MTHKLFYKLTLLTGFIGSSVACQPRAFHESKPKDWEQIVLDPQPAGQNNMPPAAQQKWDLMRSLHPATVQNLCEPARYSPPPGVAYRGVAILLHGFSSCPGQYENLAPKLAKAGYEVLVPLYPGHGRIPKAITPREDDVDSVPVSPVPWVGFTEDINELASKFKGEKMLVGLSQGSNIALRAMQLAPDLYDRIYLMSPKLRNESAFLHGLLRNSIKSFGVEEFILGRRTGWSECEKEEALPPHNRPGFCYMKIENAVAMIDFGGQVVSAAIKGTTTGWKTRTQVQFALSHSDDGTCNDAAREVLASLRKGGNQAKGCVMPKEIPHSMFSLRDRPYEKPWLPNLFQTVEDFLTTGKNVDGSQDVITDCALKW